MNRYSPYASTPYPQSLSTQSYAELEQGVPSEQAPALDAMTALAPMPWGPQMGSQMLVSAAAAPSIVTQMMMHNRLSQAANSQSAGHKTPFTVSIPVGPVSISAGAGIIRLKTTQLEMLSDASGAPDAPCYLGYTAQTEHGMTVGFGVGSSGLSLGGYGGGSRGHHIAFRRRIDAPEDKQALALAARTQKPPAHAKWLCIPDPHAIADFAVGEMWEQTAVTRVGGGIKFGHWAQKLDIGGDVVGQFIVRVEKTAQDQAVVTVIPIRFKRIYTDSGNLLEKVSREREETSGRSLSYRFRLDTQEGLTAYRAIIDAQMPQVDNLGEAHDPDAVVLLRRETVQQTTVRRSLTLLRGRLGLFSNDHAATQALETGLSHMTLQTTGHDDSKKGYNGEEQHEWEVHACYQDHMHHGTARKEFLEMVVYQRYALKSADKTFRSLLRKTDELALRDSRNEQLLALSQAVGHPLPSFDMPQVQGAFAVELMFVLKPEHIDALSHMREEDVRLAAMACHLGRRQTQEVIESFGEMRRIEAASDAAKWQSGSPHNLAAVGGIMHAAHHAFDINVDNRLSGDYALVDQDATAQQAQILQRFLRKPNVLQMLTTFLAQHQALASAPCVVIDCPAYDKADKALADLDTMRDITMQTHDIKKLTEALRRLGDIEQILLEAVATAASDALSQHYDRNDWYANQIAWREGLDAVGALRSFEHLSKRSDAVDLLLEDDDVFKAASVVQRVGVLAQALTSRTTDYKLKRLAKRLDDVLEVMDDALEDLYDVIKEGSNADDVLRWQGRRMLDALAMLAQNPALEEYSGLRRQLEHMQVLLTPQARALFVDETDSTSGVFQPHSDPAQSQIPYPIPQATWQPEGMGAREPQSEVTFNMQIMPYGFWQS